MVGVVIDKMRKGEGLVPYSARTNHFLFSGKTRHTGADYSTAHLGVVANRVGDIVRQDSRYYDIALAASWWHDGPEDIPGLDVYNPYEFFARKDNGKVYLNDLLGAAGKYGDWTSYIVDLVTHREEDEKYFDYVKHTFDFPRARWNWLEAIAKPFSYIPGFAGLDYQNLRNLHAVAGIIKTVDMRYNTDPDEKVNFEKALNAYANLKDADEDKLVEFYKKNKVIDAFEQKNDYSYNPKLFEEQFRQRAKHRLQARSIDNLGYYLPLAEDKLLVEWDGPEFFDKAAMRALLKEAYIDSIRVFPLDIHAVKLFGFNHRKAKVPGYKSLRREIREEIASNQLKIEKVK